MADAAGASGSNRRLVADGDADLREALVEVRERIERAPGAGGIGDAGSGGYAVLELRVVRCSVARDQERARTVHEVGDVRGRVARSGQRPELSRRGTL